MKKNNCILVTFLLMLLIVQSSIAQKNKDSLFNKKTVLNYMHRVADWQINDWNANGFKKPKYNWTYATAYTGIFELGKLSKDKKYIDFLITIGNDLKWNTGSRRFFADDYCVAQTFCNLYLLKKEPKMIESFKILADSIAAQPHT